MRFTWLLLCGLAWGQVRLDEPLPSQFIRDSWGSKDGLPEETIFSITQTSDGFLWLANANGLVRYDGSTFEHYQPRQDLGGHVRQEINRMGPGPDNSVWVYSRAFGLVRFHKGVFRRAPEYPTPCTVNQIRVDGDGSLIVCTERILRIAGDRVEELLKAPGRSGRGILSAERDKDGQLWIGWTKGGVTRLDGGGRFTGLPAEGSVYEILGAGQNRFWVATTAGLAWVEDGRAKIFTTRDGLPSDNIVRIARSSDGALWIGTDKGIAIGRHGRFETVPSLPPNAAEAIFEDREGSIWISLADINLYRLRQPKFLTWGTSEGLPTRRPQAVIPAGGSIWIAQGGDLWRLVDGRPKHIPLGGVAVHFLETDGEGQLWVLGDRHVYVVNPADEQVRELPFPATAGDLLTISRDRSRRMWIAGRKGLLLGENGVIRSVPMQDLPRLGVRTDVRQSRDGRLWLSGNRPGLFELIGDRATPVPLGDDVELKRIYTFYIDANNDFWFGFDGGGLARWRNGKLARFGQRIGRRLNFVYHFAEDSDGYFWLGLRSGLVRVSKAELNAFLDGAAPHEPHLTFYDIADGLRSYNFGGANRAVASLEPGTILWLPSLLGAVRIDTRHIAENRHVPPVHILSVSADGTRINKGGVISVPPGTDALRFQVSVPSLVAPERVRIRYRLEPFEGAWQATHLRSMVYSRVPPGEYRFSIIASNNDGVWNENGASVPVVVEPHFYQTWWFRLLAFALFASALASVFRWRTERLRRENENLERRVDQRTAQLSEAMRAAESAAQAKADFLATMSHEIRTPMHGVLGTLELLSETGLNDQQDEYLSTARTSSKSLLALLNEILDLSRLEAGRMNLHSAPFSLRQTALEVVRLLEAQANMKGIALRLSYATGMPDYFEGDEVRIRQIIFNLAGNAVKFTSSGEVSLSVTGRASEDAGPWALQIEVRDTGIGIAADRIPHLFQNFVQINSAANRQFAGSGLGLAICQRLAAMMNGAITVSSEPGQGSTFTFAVALPASSPPAAPARRSEASSVEPVFAADILLAEDNRVNQKLATEMLTRLGCRVTLARNGREAVEACGRQTFPVVLMDCQMPEMDGFEAARQIREKYGHQSIIIALTANSLPGDRERCLEAGMNDYLTKPFGRADLVRVLKQYLSESVAD